MPLGDVGATAGRPRAATALAPRLERWQPSRSPAGSRRPSCRPGRSSPIARAPRCSSPRGGHAPQLRPRCRVPAAARVDRRAAQRRLRARRCSRPGRCRGSPILAQVLLAGGRRATRGGAPRTTGRCASSRASERTSPRFLVDDDGIDVDALAPCSSPTVARPSSTRSRRSRTRAGARTRSRLAARAARAGRAPRPPDPGGRPLPARAIRRRPAAHALRARRLASASSTPPPSRRSSRRGCASAT